MSKKNIPKLGDRPRMAWLALDLLIIDRSYQRDANGKHAAAILSNFDWRYFQCVTVSRLTNGEYAVIDGQHRVLAARLHPEVIEVPCVIVEADTVAEQARGFVVMNETHKRITPVEMYWAGVVSKEPVYLSLEALLDRCGILVGDMGISYRKAGCTIAIATIRIRISRGHEESTERALRALMVAWGTEPGAIANQTIGTVELIARYHPEITWEDLGKMLKHWPTAAKFLLAGRVRADKEDRKWGNVLRMMLEEKLLSK